MTPTPPSAHPQPSWMPRPEAAAQEVALSPEVKGRAPDAPDAILTPQLSLQDGDIQPLPGVPNPPIPRELCPTE